MKQKKWKTRYEPLTHLHEIIIIPEINESVSPTVWLTGGTFMNRFHWKLEHFALQNVMQIDSLYALCCDWCWDSPGQYITVVLCRWGMQLQSSSCWCGWRRQCHWGRRLSWRLQHTSMSAVGEHACKYSRWWLNTRIEIHKSEYECFRAWKKGCSNNEK